MTTLGAATSTSRRRVDRWAHALSELLSPVVLAYLTCVWVAGATTQPLVRGVALGLLVASLCAGLPFVLVVLASRRQLLSGRHVPELRERPAVLTACAASAATGLLLAWWLGAPPEVFALVTATVAGLVVAAVISTRWKLSIHVAAAAGAVSAVASVVTPWALLGALLVGALAWARVRLTAHDVRQVVGGGVIGAVVTASVMLALH